MFGKPTTYAGAPPATAPLAPPVRYRLPVHTTGDAGVAMWRHYQAQSHTAQRAQYLAVVAANDRRFSGMKG
jgi:hypothetical protein